MKKFFCLNFLLIFFFAGLSAQEVQITTITINNARQTSYSKSAESGNDTIILEGSVELEVKKDSTTSKIKADRITYDRVTEMLYAEGNVEIVTSSSASGEETTTADSLLLNTATLEGVFDGGRVVQTQSDSLNLPSGSTLIVFSEMFGKTSNNVIAFKNSSLTFCDEEDPHWKINSTRTWLLPGGEFAFFNALLYVGNIPVLYLPAFYYPKDELIFNPVFSYRKREGYSIQTTTYIWGRKPLDSSSSTTTSSSSSSSSTDTSSTASEALTGLYNFVKPSSLKEQVREGLILHNLDEDYSGNTNEYAKILADWYSNLGIMVGFDGNFAPSEKYLTSLKIKADIGLSNTVFMDSNYKYYPFSSAGLTYKDEAQFLGLTTPFRYSADLELTLSKPFSIKLSLPIYSDPFYNYDFKTNRSETMDWISYLLENASYSDSIEAVTITEVSSFMWQLTASASPSLPDFIKPYVSSVSANVNSYVNISSKSATTSSMTYKGSTPSDNWASYSPSRKFYYPSLITPASATVSFSGTLFSWPLSVKTKKTQTQSYPIQLNKPDELKSAKELKEEAEAAEREKKADEASEEEAKNKEKDEEKEKSDEEEAFEFFLPEIDYSPELSNVSDIFNYKLTYSASANLVTQISYSADKLEKSDDFKWENIRSSMYTLKTPVTLSSTMNYGGDFFSVVNGISYSPIYQSHPYISEDTSTGGYTESARKTLQLADYKAEKQDLLNTNSVTIKPFTNFSIFKDSSLAWNSTIKLYRRNFTGDADNPQWENLGIDWADKECITVNSLTGVISAKELNDKIGQSLTLTAIMPPLQKQYTASLALTFPYVTASVSTGFQENTDSSTDKEWIKNPLQQNLTVSIPLLEKTLSFTESFSYNLEDDNPDSLKFSGSWNGLSVAYVMSHTYGYDFSTSSGWTTRSSKEFLPYSLSLSYTPTAKTFYSWFNRISITPGINTSIVADLLRPTNSYFVFTPSISFKLTDFMTLSFSSTSRNSVLYWYFHNEAGDLYSDWGGFPGNIFKDLIDSFRFDQSSLREGSGFKLKSLNMTLTHDLHDWTFNFTFKIEPRVIQENGTKVYDFSPYITIGIVWNPMESMKTSIVDKYGEWSME
ncbi:MAG: hypothetical protein K6C97_07320 [Treponema sp.]|nr:hypothetical protein [Treponema sp.]